MSNFRTHQPREHIFWRFFLALGVATVLLFVSGASVKAAWEMYQTFDGASIERIGAEEELAALHTQHEQMSATLKSLGSERGVEAAVRERFGVARPGEGEIRIMRAGAGEAGKETTDPNLFSRFFNVLFVR